MTVWRLPAVLAVIHAVVAAGMAIIPSAEGPAGAIAYAAMYVAPAIVVALLIRSSRDRWRLTGGWSSLGLAVFYVAILAGNWPGYSSNEQALAIAVNLPSAGVYLAVFWAAILRRRKPAPTAGV